MSTTAKTVEASLEATVLRLLRERFPQHCSKPAVADTPEAALYYSPEGTAARQEMIWNSRKLWQREYVDGNGGNLSCRLGETYILCTPSMCSKVDLTLDDLCLTDLSGKMVFGRYPRTSELLLHVEIYKANPKARAVVHCHPPHATAYAIAGISPLGNALPEQEVFVGPVAVAPYDTPGTQAFAETVIPFVEKHNTIILASHGVVTWSDTVTHAEWLAEVLDTYCRTLILTRQLGAPINTIPDGKIDGLLAMKQRLGLPDTRLEHQPVQPEVPFPRPIYSELLGEPGLDLENLAREIAAAARQHSSSDEVS